MNKFQIGEENLRVVLFLINKVSDFKNFSLISLSNFIFLNMFRTPVRNSFGKIITGRDLELTFSSEKTPSSESPQSHSKNLFIVTSSKNYQDEEVKQETTGGRKYDRDDIYLRAEIELLKNDLENERQKNEDLSGVLSEKEKEIKMIATQLVDKKNELRVMKKQISEINTEKLLESNKLNAEIECFQKENNDLHQQLENLKYVECHISILKQELSGMYQNKLQKFKDVMRERHEKYKLREAQFAKEKSKLSSELTSLLKKFSVLEEHIPALKGMINPTNLHKSETSEDVVFKVRENHPNKSHSCERSLKKNHAIASGKENNIIF